MGMTPEQYWEQDPYLAVAYRKAYRLKRKADNEQAWLQGFYNCYAFTVSLGNVVRNPGQRTQNYLEKPIDFLPPTPAEQKKKERENRAKMQKVMEELIRKQRQQKQTKGD